MAHSCGSLTNKTILIVDDAPDVRLLVRKILEGDGATVLESESIDGGIEQCSKGAPHLILLDLELPIKSGFDFLGMRLSDAILKQIPTVVLSGRKDRSSILNAISLEASDYLLKPFRATLLLQKVRKCLRVSSFLIHKFDFALMPDVEFSVEADISKVSEVGCEIECSVRIAPNERVVIDSDFLKSLGVADLIMRTLDDPAKYHAPGRYLSEINFIGIDEELARNIRIAIGTWK